MSKRVSVRKHERKTSSGEKVTVRKHTRQILPTAGRYGSKMLPSVKDFPIIQSDWKLIADLEYSYYIEWRHTDESRNEYIIAEKIKTPEDLKSITKQETIWEIRHYYQHRVIQYDYYRTKGETSKGITRMKRASPFIEGTYQTSEYRKITDALRGW